MFKSNARRWYAIILPGIVLLTVFFIYSGGWRGMIPGALSASTKMPARAVSTGNTGTNSCGSRRPDFGGTIVVDSNESVCNSLMAFSSKVAINGEVHGDVDAFNSTVVVAGKVDGNVVLYNGSLTLQNGASISGTIDLYGSHWEADAGSHHQQPKMHPSTLSLLFNAMSQFSFPFWSILIWAALGLLLIWLLPEHVTLVRATAIQNTKRSFVVGLLSILLAPPILMVLTALILPVPLAVIIALALVAAWAFGTVAIGWLLGEHIVRAINLRHNTRPVQVAVGLAALALLGALPYIGWLINLLVGLIGLGTVFLSRFGTRLYGQPRKPLDF